MFAWRRHPGPRVGARATLGRQSDARGRPRRRHWRHHGRVLGPPTYRRRRPQLGDASQRAWWARISESTPEPEARTRFPDPRRRALYTHSPRRIRAFGDPDKGTTWLNAGRRLRRLCSIQQRRLRRVEQFIPEGRLARPPGKAPSAARHNGRDAVYGYFGKLMEVTGGTFKATLVRARRRRVQHGVQRSTATGEKRQQSTTGSTNDNPQPNKKRVKAAARTKPTA